jgi:hypothetical protein
MPDQPDDPIHYDMKIPPEKDPSSQDQESEKAELDRSAPKPDATKDTQATHSQDKSQSGRQLGE